MTDSEKLDWIITNFQTMQTDMQTMKTDMQTMKTDMQTMQTDMQTMKTDMQTMQTDLHTVELNITGINVHLENVTDRNISILAENHMTLIDKLNQAIKVSDKTLMYEVQVNMLTGKVERLEKEMSDVKKKIS